MRNELTPGVNARHSGGPQADDGGWGTVKRARAGIIGTAVVSRKAGKDRLACLPIRFFLPGGTGDFSAILWQEVSFRSTLKIKLKGEFSC
jgi:hypothetical protein